MICTTTLNKIKTHSPCQPGWKKLLGYLDKTSADDEPVTLQAILDSNGLDDALWCLRASDAPEFEMWRFARLVALDVAHLWDMPAIVRKYLETGDATKRNAARAALAASWASQDAALAASWASQDAAWDAARAAARAASWASQDAAWDAAWDAARDAVWAAAQDATIRSASWEIQTERFISVFCTESKS